MNLMIPRKEKVKVCLTLCDTMDWSLPGFFVHGILQVRIQEWVAILFYRGSSLHSNPDLLHYR